MVKRCAALVGLVACTAPNPAFLCPDTDPSCTVGDAAPDAAPTCLGTGGYVACVPVAPVGPRTPTRIDTSNDCDAVSPEGWCVLAATDITITGHVPVVGMRPLVLMATGKVTVSDGAILDATGANIGGGAGADLACGAGGTNGVSLNSHGGGGAGGSFVIAGAGGGAGGGGAGGGGLAATLTPQSLQGGCSGTDGGAGTATNGTRGRGGGGVYLLAGAQLVILGTVNASGEGGHAGVKAGGGGGGGGSGGMIVLSAPAIMTQATTQILANGGGGASGASNNANGADGATATSAAGTPTGGVGGGGAGGVGAFMSNGAQTGTPSGEGGGGGGGATGAIFLLSGSLGGAQVSPAPS